MESLKTPHGSFHTVRFSLSSKELLHLQYVDVFPHVVLFVYFDADLDPDLNFLNIFCSHNNIKRSPNAF